MRVYAATVMSKRSANADDREMRQKRGRERRLVTGARGNSSGIGGLGKPSRRPMIRRSDATKLDTDRAVGNTIGASGDAGRDVTAYGHKCWPGLLQPAGPTPASPETFAGRAGPLDPEVLTEIGAPPQSHKTNSSPGSAHHARKARESERLWTRVYPAGGGPFVARR
jgi:hypothetical protein